MTGSIIRLSESIWPLEETIGVTPYTSSGPVRRFHIVIVVTLPPPLSLMCF